MTHTVLIVFVMVEFINGDKKKEVRQSVIFDFANEDKAAKSFKKTYLFKIVVKPFKFFYLVIGRKTPKEIEKDKVKTF